VSHGRTSILDQLVTRITSAPILAYPDYNEPFVLHTDASQEGLGAVLYQEQNSEMRVIGYGSRSLTLAENSVKVIAMTLRFLFKYYLNREIFKMIHYKETMRVTEVNLIWRIQQTIYRKTKQQRTLRSLP
jgi:hypothetical protein